LANPDGPELLSHEAREAQAERKTQRELEETARRSPSPRSLLLGIAGYSGAALVTLLLSLSFFESEGPALYRLLDWRAATGIAFLIALWLLQRRLERPGLAVAIVWTLFALLSVANILAEWHKPHYYGDSDLVSAFVATHRVVPKWLAGTAILGDFYAWVWTAPWLHERLPATLRNAFHFVATWGALATWAGAVALSLRWPGRLAITLPVFGTLYVAFGAGYLEYYPFITALYLASLAYLFFAPLEERSPLALGLLAGVLPTLYIGFIPLAVGVLVFGALTHPRKVLQLAACALAAYGLVVRVLWRAPLVEFFQGLRGALDKADTVKIFPRYAGHLAQPDDMFFPLGYALSPEHLVDIFYVALHGGLLLPLVLLGWALYRGRKRLSRSFAIEAVRKDFRWGLAAALTAQQLHYLFFMVPVYGPRRDFDLFFSVILGASFCAGFVWDWLLTGSEQRSASRQRFLLLSLNLGHTAATLSLLLFHGLPAID
jgi:hypothetical protein